MVKGTSPYADKIICIFQKKEKEGITRVYYGDKPNKVYIANEKKIKEYRTKPQTSPYILIKFDKYSYKTLKEQYDAIYKEAVYLKELTNGTRVKKQNQIQYVKKRKQYYSKQKMVH